MSPFSRKALKQSRLEPAEFVEPLYDLYFFNPQPDITSYEVALLLRDVTIGGSTFPARHLIVRERHTAIVNDWPEAMARHFKRAYFSIPYQVALSFIASADGAPKPNNG